MIQASFEVAAQAHPAGAVTFTEPVPAEAAALMLELDRLYEQETAA